MILYLTSQHVIENEEEESANIETSRSSVGVTEGERLASSNGVGLHCSYVFGESGFSLCASFLVVESTNGLAYVPRGGEKRAREGERERERE